MNAKQLLFERMSSVGGMPKYIDDSSIVNQLYNRIPLLKQYRTESEDADLNISMYKQIQAKDIPNNMASFQDQNIQSDDLKQYYNNVNFITINSQFVFVLNNKKNVGSQEMQQMNFALSNAGVSTMGNGGDSHKEYIFSLNNNIYLDSDEHAITKSVIRQHMNKVNEELSYLEKFVVESNQGISKIELDKIVNEVNKRLFHLDEMTKDFNFYK